VRIIFDRRGRRGFLMLGVACGLLAAAPGSASAACSNATALPGQVSTTAAEAAELCVLNAERTRHGIRPVKLNKKLLAAARKHAADMVRRRYFSHFTKGSNASPFARMRAAGYRYGLEEALGFGGGSLGTPAAILRQELSDAPHARIMLNRRAKAIGIAVVYGSPFGGSGATYVFCTGTK
jgi:uncharacterized protein YkwD